MEEALEKVGTAISLWPTGVAAVADLLSIQATVLEHPDKAATEEWAMATRIRIGEQEVEAERDLMASRRQAVEVAMAAPV